MTDPFSMTEMTEEKKDSEASAPSVTGRVKWFDSARGYGFVVSDDGGADILLHANVLRNFGQNSIAEGAVISLTVTDTPRGLQAQSVNEIVSPPDAATSDHPLSFDEDLVGGPLEPARIKWFDRSKGFGFANVFGRPEDVFVHIEVLRRSALSDLQPGEAVAIRVAEGQRGHLATEVTTWENGFDLPS